MRRAALLLIFCGCGSDPAEPIAVVELARRIVARNAPETFEVGRASGCASYAANVGSGVGNLVILSGGMEQHLRPDDFSGRINLVLLANVERWGEADFDLEILRGDISRDGGFIVKPESFVGGDSAGKAV